MQCSEASGAPFRPSRPCRETISRSNVRNVSKADVLLTKVSVTNLCHSDYNQSSSRPFMQPPDAIGVCAASNRKGVSKMRKLLLATTATLAVVATPAAARDGSGYVGLEGGILFPHSQNGVFTATFTQTAQSPAAGTAAPLPGTGLVGALPAALATPPTAVTGASSVKWKEGYDVDLIGGYDFGMFRLEGELGYKRSKIKRFTQDAAFGTAIATGLHPVGTTGTTFVFPTVSASAFN